MYNTVKLKILEFRYSHYTGPGFSYCKGYVFESSVSGLKKVDQTIFRKKIVIIISLPNVNLVFWSHFQYRFGEERLCHEQKSILHLGASRNIVLK